jgi:L-asparaginase II
MQRSDDVARNTGTHRATAIAAAELSSSVALPLSTEGALEKFALCTKVFALVCLRHKPRNSPVTQMARMES